MNGIIHNCTHSEKWDPSIVLSNEQMITKIFQYIEKLFVIIKPKSLMYMAIDGTYFRLLGICFVNFSACLRVGHARCLSFDAIAMMMVDRSWFLIPISFQASHLARK